MAGAGEGRRKSLRPNRTTVGLKEGLTVKDDDSAVQSQSHHSGIESTVAAETAPLAKLRPNRTTVGLKDLAAMGGPFEKQRPNRTTVGLKVTSKSISATVQAKSQSHHSGIESCLPPPPRRPLGLSQSHHSGIERRTGRISDEYLAESQSHHSGIESL